MEARVLKTFWSPVRNDAWDRTECQVALVVGGAGEGSLDDHPGYCCKDLCSSEGQGIKYSHSCLLKTSSFISSLPAQHVQFRTLHFGVVVKESSPDRSCREVNQGRAAGRQILGYWRVSSTKEHLARTSGQPLHSSVALSPKHPVWPCWPPHPSLPSSADAEPEPEPSQLTAVGVTDAGVSVEAGATELPVAA